MHVLRFTLQFFSSATRIKTVFIHRLSSIIAAQLLGFDNFIPPFANTSGSDILRGVNYASGGAGIRNETGSHSVQIKEPSSF